MRKKKWNGDLVDENKRTKKKKKKKKKKNYKI
jgi:hypothetical protein